MDVEELLERHALASSMAAEERRLYQRLPARRRALVDERLPVLDRFIRARAEGKPDPDAYAAEIGVKRRAFYRLLERLDEFGPVGALAPSAIAGRQRRSDAGSGLPDEAKALIRTIVLRSPGISQAGLLEIVRKAFPKAAKSTVRSEFLASRKRMDLIDGMKFLRRIVIDTVAIDLPVRFGDGTSWLVTTSLADEETGTLVGLVVSTGPDIDTLGDVLDETIRAIGNALRSRLELADGIESIVWVATDRYEAEAALMEEQPRTERGAPRLRIVRHGKYRFGSEVSKLYGDSFALYRMLPRATVDPRASLGDGDPEPLETSEVLRALREEQSTVNRLISRWALAGASSRPPSRRRVEHARRLARELVRTFERALRPRRYELLLERIESIGR